MPAGGGGGKSYAVRIERGAINRNLDRAGMKAVERKAAKLRGQRRRGILG